MEQISKATSLWTYLGDTQINFLQVKYIFLYSTSSRQALGHTQPPVQCVTGAILLRGKRSEREGDRSPPSSNEIKNGGTISPLPISLHCMVLN
jgi:hypothetical protein